MSVTSYPTLRLKLTMPQALKLQFLPAIPGSNAAASAAAAQAAADAATAAANTAVAATANKVDKTGDVMTGFLQLNANPVANLQAATKQYVDAHTDGVQTINSQDGPAVTLVAGTNITIDSPSADQIRIAAAATGISDAPSDGNLYGRLNATWAQAQPLDADLTSLASASATNQWYYRSAANTWSPVTVGATMTFTGGVLNTTAGGGNVIASGTPVNGQWARWTSAATIEGVDAASTGFQLLDADLTSIASATITNQWLYRSAADTWSPVTIGANLTFTGGTLAATGGGGGAPVGAEYITSTADATLTAERVLTDTATITWDRTTPGQIKASTAVGGGNVSNSGTPTVGQYAKWVTATTIQGVATATVLSDIGAQPIDADLTAIAALSGTNTIYYRSAANTWTAVNVSTGLAFAGGNLTSTVTSGAPVGAEYITSTTDATLTSERVLTDTATVTWDRTTAGQIKANAAGGGGTSTTISDTPPGSPANGSLWWESDTGILFISYNDGNTTQWVAVGGGGAALGALPTQQIFTSSSGTYTTPANCRRLEVRMVGGGGGGAGSTAGTAGTNTTFSTATAGGGSGGAILGSGGAGGTASGGTLNLSGGGGGGAWATASGALSPMGGHGGSSAFGGGAQPIWNAAGSNAPVNTGGGGAGGGNTNSASNVNQGGGGGAGGYVELYINSPAATYSYAVGPGGGGGTASGTSLAGGNGGSGIIIVIEIY